MRVLTAALCLIAAALNAREDAAPAYPSPVEMAMAADGSRFYVVCEGYRRSSRNTTRRASSVLRRVRVGQHPKSISLSADGRRLYVANSWSDTVSVISVASTESGTRTGGGLGAERCCSGSPKAVSFT